MEIKTYKCVEVGDDLLCLYCKETGKAVKLIPKPKVFIRLVGSPVVSGIKHIQERYYCNLCGAWFNAPIPNEIVKENKYAPSAVSSIAISHYYLGLPFYRIEKLQTSCGVPLADATQFGKVEQLARDVTPIHNELIKLSANSHHWYYDDTGAKILGQEGSSHATALVALHNHHKIYTFHTSEMVAGKEMSQLLIDNRDKNLEQPLMTMRDASSHNNIVLPEEVLTFRIVIALCLVHGRRKFYKLLEQFPVEAGFVVDSIAKIYQHESHCVKNKLTPTERLAYHREHSQPVMDALYTWLVNKRSYTDIEYNSPLGQAIAYMLKHWQALTEFLRTEGCAIDNNICEQAIKVLIRYRKNSLFYLTVNGAKIGDKLMSIIHTAVQNKMDPFSYLNALQENSQAVADNPDEWLPWNYDATLATLEMQALAA